MKTMKSIIKRKSLEMKALKVAFMVIFLYGTIVFALVGSNL